MELSEFAEDVLLTCELSVKLRRPASRWTDERPGPGRRIPAPKRPAQLQFAARRTAPAMPKAVALRDPSKRAVAHHIMANHELQALEVMAMTLLAFPNAPGKFRTGLADIMLDEQRHTRLHIQRSAELGLTFGDLPVNGYIWTRAMDYTTVLEYICGLPLVFENGNLDHTAEFERYFIDAGDRRSAAIMRAIQRDEIRHVAFGMDWLRMLKPPEQSDFATWEANLKWPLRPSKARGREFDEAPRRQAGMNQEFIDELREWEE